MISFPLLFVCLFLIVTIFMSFKNVPYIWSTYTLKLLSTTKNRPLLFLLPRPAHSARGILQNTKSSSRISNPMDNIFSVPYPEIMGNHK